MKQKFKKYIPLFVFLSTIGMNSFLNAECHATTFFSPRSQGLDTARWMSGLSNDYHIYLYDECELYGTLNGTLEFTKSFRSKNLAECLFGNGLTTDCDTSTIVVSGSQVATRGARDWFADYFGLPTDYRSVITVKPEVRNIIFDIDFYLGLDNWRNGLYLRIHAPIVNTRWKLNAEECNVEAGVNGYDAGYFAADAVANGDLNKRALNFLAGNYSLSSIGLRALTASKWSLDGCGKHGKTGLADLRWELGWNFWQCADYHIGLNIRFAAPTGNKAEGEFFFEPIYGNGKHWEVGGGLTSHVILWRDCDCDRYFGFYLDASATHLFKNSQVRNFDLVGKQNSRYALAMKLGATDPVGALQGNPSSTTATAAGNTGPTSGYTASTYQFQDQYVPVANLTQRKVDVSVGVQGEFTALFDFTSCGFSWDLGYNLWGRSCEKVSIDCGCPSTLPANTWALKGDARVYGFPSTGCTGTTPAPATLSSLALGGTESLATIFGGTNRPCGTAVAATQNNNPGVDLAQFAYNGAPGPLPTIFQPVMSRPVAALEFTACNDAAFLALQTRTSIQSIFLKEADIDVNSTRTKGLSHKLFTSLSYTWNERECGWIPYLGIGAKVEWAQGSCGDSCNTSTACPTTSTTVVVACTTSSCSTSNNDCGSCSRCALSEWGVWIKGGFSFN